MKGFLELLDASKKCLGLPSNEHPGDLGAQIIYYNNEMKS